jgi:uncharacterized protein
VSNASRVVAVIGASSDRRKYGNRAVRAFQRQGYTVVPISVREAEIEGVRAYRSVLEVPGPIHMATMYVRPEIGMGVMAELAEKKVAEVWLNPGTASEELVRRARELNIEPIVACSIVGIGEDPHA